METYLCLNCNMEVPLLNEAIHSFRCKNPKLNYSFRKDNDNPVQINNTSIENDQLENVMSSGSHVQTSESIENDQLQNLMSLDAVDAPMSIITDDNFNPTIDYWECSVCTLQNSLVDQFCQACNTRRIGDLSCTLPENQHGWICSTCTLSNSISSSHCTICSNIRPPDPICRERLIPSNQNDINHSFFREHHFSNRQNYPLPNRNDHELNSSMINSMMFGAVAGAGLAYISGRSVTQGAFTGLGIGALGNQLVQQSNHTIRNSETRNQNNNNNQLTRREIETEFRQLEEHLNYLIRNIYESDEHILSMSNPSASGVPLDVIDNLPRHKMTSEDITAANNNNEIICSICMENYKVHDNILTLPCIHSYHENCIKEWLKQSKLCPVCKTTL